MIGVTVQSDVSLGRRIYRPEMTKEQNDYFYGSECSPQGIGHNLTFLATVTGPLNPQTGLLHRYDHLQEILKSTVQILDHQLINETVSFFLRTVPTAEKLAQFVFSELRLRLPSEVSLRKIRLYEGAKLWVDVSNSETVQVTREWLIHCVHRHHNPQLTMEENQALYNKCAVTHGHEYRIQVTVQGAVDPEWGIVAARQPWTEIVQEKLIEPFDGQFLNDLIGNTSGEIIAGKFTEILKAHLPSLLTVAVRETRKNSFFAVPSKGDEAAIQQLL